MTETVFCLTEATSLAACIIWACSLAFVRTRLGLKTSNLPKNQIVIMRLLALAILGRAIKISLAAPPVPALAISTMLLSINSIMIAAILCFVGKKR